MQGGGRKKLTRQELKEDDFVAWVMQTWLYIEQNYPKILAGLGVVAILVLVGVFIEHRADVREQAAVEALGQVRISLMEGKSQDAMTEAAQVAQDYSGKPEAGQALLILADLDFEARKYPAARASFQKYLDAFGEKGPQGYNAWAGVAACLEEEGKVEQAAQHYAAYATKFKTSMFAAVALGEAARCYRAAGKRDLAETEYKRIVKEYPESPTSRQAEVHLREMGVAD